MFVLFALHAARYRCVELKSLKFSQVFATIYTLRNDFRKYLQYHSPLPCTNPPSIRLRADNTITITITIGILIEIPHVIRYIPVRIRIPISHMLIKLDRRREFEGEATERGEGSEGHTDVCQ